MALPPFPLPLASVPANSFRLCNWREENVTLLVYVENFSAPFQTKVFQLPKGSISIILYERLIHHVHVTVLLPNPHSFYNNKRKQAGQSLPWMRCSCLQSSQQSAVIIHRLGHESLLPNTYIFVIQQSSYQIDDT
jgi:hypothetical protein